MAIGKDGAKPAEGARPNNLRKDPRENPHPEQRRGGTRGEAEKDNEKNPGARHKAAPTQEGKGIAGVALPRAWVLIHFLREIFLRNMLAVCVFVFCICDGLARGGAGSCAAALRETSREGSPKTRGIEGCQEREGGAAVSDTAAGDAGAV